MVMATGRSGDSGDRGDARAAGSVARAGGAGGAGRRGPGKSIPPKLYRISDIVEYTGVSRQTIHNYTTMGLITEARRTSGGHRLYDESVFARLDLIDEMKRRRQSLREIRRHFAGLDDPSR